MARGGIFAVLIGVLYMVFRVLDVEVFEPPNTNTNDPIEVNTRISNFAHGKRGARTSQFLQFVLSRKIRASRMGSISLDGRGHEWTIRISKRRFQT